MTEPEANDPNAPRTRTAARGPRLLLATLFAALLALLGLEAAARWLPVEAFSMETLDPGRKIQNHRFQPHPYTTFTPRPSWDTPPERKLVAHHNSIGFRGPETTWEKPAGRFRIVCLGGSSTYGYTTTGDATTYPARLQVHLASARPDLDVEVINCGTPGYTSFESLGILGTRASALEPDVVIVYHGVNDAHASLYRSSANPDAPAQVDNTHYRSPWQVSSKGSLESLFESSHAFLVLRRYTTDYAEQQTLLNASLVVDYDPDQKNRFDNPEPSPVGFENFERNLRSIVGIAGVHGAKVVLATQGTDYDDFKKEPGGSGPAQKAACARNGETVRRVARAHAGVHLADIAPRIETIATERKTGGKDDVFTSTVHFTDHGADLLAQMMARELAASGFLPARQ